MSDTIAWIIFGVVCYLLLSLSYGVVLFYVDRTQDDSKWLINIVGGSALLIAFLALFIIPIDIYVVTSDIDSDTGEQLDPDRVKLQGSYIKALYYILWGILLSFAFIWLPCTMFFYEEKGDGSRTVMQRCCTAFTYTFGFIVVVSGLFVIGFFVSNDQPVENWSNVTDQFTNKGLRAIEFVIAVFTTIGMIGQVTYTAFGLAALPIAIAKDRETALSRSDQDQLNTEISTLERKLSTIGRKRSKSHADEVRFRRFSDQLKRAKLQKQLDAPREKPCYRCVTCCWNCLSPFRIVIGIILFLFSTLIAVSLLLHAIDQAMNGEISSGFALKKETIANPLGLVLTYTSKVFPLDYAVFSFLVLWLFVSTLYAFSWTGIRCFCIRLARVNRGRTMHNSLALLVWTTIMVVLSFSMTLLEIAPKYTEFGHQFKTAVSTDAPSLSPTRVPTLSPTTKEPTHGPTFHPTHKPTREPTGSPSMQPTKLPTHTPSNTPTNTPTDAPTESPTQAPTNSTNTTDIFTYQMRRLEKGYNVNKAHQACTQSESTSEQCTVTQIYLIYQFVLVKMPIFGIIFFGFQFVFIFTFIVGVICSMRTPKPDDYERLLEEDRVEEVFY